MGRSTGIPLPDFSKTGLIFGKEGVGTPPPFFTSNPLPDNFSATGGNAPPAAPPTLDEILAKDPFYQAALGNLNAQGIYDKSSRDAALKQAYIRFGDAGTGLDLSFLPADLKSEISGIIGPDIRSLAQKNTAEGLSILARLQDAAKQANKQAVDVLGSRGLFRSGETGYQLNRNQLYAAQAQYDATNKFLDYIMGVQAAYLAAERQRQALLLQAQKDAAGNYVPPTNTTTNPPTNPPTNPYHPPVDPHHPYGPGITGDVWPDPPQPTGGPWNPPVGPLLDDILKGLIQPPPGGSRYAQPM